jgi:opacity protein-like surface antigen
MKKLLFTLLFAMGLFVAQAQIQVGVGLGYGLDNEEAGLNLRAGYHFDENWRLMGDYMTYFIEGDGVSYNEININANYAFGSETIRPYGLAGLNITTVKIDFLGSSISNSEFGLNLGGGLQYFVAEKVAVYGEARYVVSEFDQLVIGAGVVIQF